MQCTIACMAYRVQVHVPDRVGLLCSEVEVELPALRIDMLLKGEFKSSS